MQRNNDFVFTIHISFETSILENMSKQQRRSSGKPNDLIHESSPYLLQHAYNPVAWKPWNKKTLEIAKKENKPILVSIGYSACHWCHVMEHESFEDEEVADIMNKHFVCIKVDREERPDVDQLYMNAAQLVTGGGGWPLNCMAFPDGRPFFAGTYFQKDKWMQLLDNIQREWTENQPKLEDYADKLLKGIKQTSAITKLDGFLSNSSNVLKLIDESVLEWSKSFDHEFGGANRAPKFPLPNNYSFLLSYGEMTQNEPITSYAHFTLKKMARGGLYDQIGGGFARYAVDNKWKVPHFEKMLYDNGQLLKLYSNAYQRTKDSEYAHVINQTALFLTTELQDKDGFFFSAYDADSEGVEGKYYVWTVDEINALVPKDSELAKAYFGISERGYWEDNVFILCRTDDDTILKQFGISKENLQKRIGHITEALLQERQKRIKPGLDDKCLTNWNALMVSGFCAAYLSTNDKTYKDQAVKTTKSILKHQLRPDNSLWHSYKAGISTIDGFLEDYAAVIQALIDVYYVSYDVLYLLKAKDLVEYTIANFYNDETLMFQFTSHQSDDLVAKQTDYFDNVIPSSNSIMCRNLLSMSHLFLDPKYRSIALEMIDLIAPRITQYGSGFSNWMLAMLEAFGAHKDIVVVGENAYAFADQLSENKKLNWTIIASESGTELPVFEGRHVINKTLIYICQDNTCLEPVDSVTSALQLLA